MSTRAVVRGCFLWVLTVMKFTAFALVVSFLAGCSGKAFEAKPAPGFIEMKEEGSAYDFRAIAPEGVAVAVRAIALDSEPPAPSDVDFWEHQGEAAVTWAGVKYLCKPKR